MCDTPHRDGLAGNFAVEMALDFFEQRALLGYVARLDRIEQRRFEFGLSSIEKTQVAVRYQQTLFDVYDSQLEGNVTVTVWPLTSTEMSYAAAERGVRSVVRIRALTGRSHASVCDRPPCHLLWSSGSYEGVLGIVRSSYIQKSAIPACYLRKGEHKYTYIQNSSHDLRYIQKTGHNAVF